MNRFFALATAIWIATISACGGSCRCEVNASLDETEQSQSVAPTAIKMRHQIMFQHGDDKEVFEGYMLLLEDAFLVVIPEQWENMAPVILTESMAGAKCVLASRVGGIPEFVEEYKTGLLAERDDPAEFASRIEWAMEHPEQVEAMGAAARARAQEAFDPESINEEFLSLYDSLVSGRDRRGA